MNSVRFWVVVTLMLVSAAVLRVRGDVDQVPSSVPLGLLPSVIGPWSSSEIPIPDGTLQVLGKGEFLNRLYVPAVTADELTPTQPQPSIGLFVGYFPTQRTGQSIHSPQNCLPGSGWTFENTARRVLTGTDGKPFEVGEYLISSGQNRAEVLYWYRSHGRSMASDYTAKLFTLVDSLRYHRTDAALIRIVTPVQSGESLNSARDRAINFAQQLSPLLAAYVPD